MAASLARSLAHGLEEGSQRCTCHVIAKASPATITGAPRCLRRSGAHPRASSNIWSSFMNSPLRRSRTASAHRGMRCRALGGSGDNSSPDSGGEAGTQRGRVARSYLVAAGRVALANHRISCFTMISIRIASIPGSFASMVVFRRLWDLCKRRSLTVVADVHTHPGDSQQSRSDQAHPMVTRVGHIRI